MYRATTRGELYCPPRRERCVGLGAGSCLRKDVALPPGDSGGGQDAGHQGPCTAEAHPGGLLTLWARPIRVGARARRRIQQPAPRGPQPPQKAPGQGHHSRPRGPGRKSSPRFPNAGRDASAPTHTPSARRADLTKLPRPCTKIEALGFSFVANGRWLASRPRMRRASPHGIISGREDR